MHIFCHVFCPDSSDIFKGNIKLILGLIWTLILKYQISMPYLDEEEEGGQKMTPKQALLAWVKSKMPESVPMENFNKDWNDGRAVACLVDAVAPGLFPECEDLDPNDKVENARAAMQAAEDWLGVPQVRRVSACLSMGQEAAKKLILRFSVDSLRNEPGLKQNG